ncbi:SAPS-domain-containing protein [Metschnikowia bicuspidata]|uniref:SAPS-domain-containing protein n=1 Tax=Metschnikowia bicuspidata TaxID=27322 RepID=A0A4P9ZHJ2_9ASCO|nr:SAPS-domain-containing protein [Metschnikowia bicuspidata]
MSGSFWKLSNGFTSLSNVSTILQAHEMPPDGVDAPSIAATLIKLLDESDLLQELMSNNSQLLEFLRDHCVLTLLVDLLIQESLSGTQLEESLRRLALEPANDAGKASSASDALLSDSENLGTLFAKDDDAPTTAIETLKERSTRYAALAAEIFSADVWSLTDTVMDSTDNLNKLWSILDIESPLSINLATYFMKIMEHLLDMKCEEMVTYLIDNQPCLVEKFIKHLANPPLMDFLLKLISTDKPDNSTGIIDFLQEQGLIDHLISALDTRGTPDSPETLLARQLSAADFLKALITILANSTTDNSTIGPNELTRELVSHEVMMRLCDIMLQGGFALGNGVGIIIEIIRKNNSDYDILPVLYISLESHSPTGRDPIYLGHLLAVFGARIADFNEVLMQPHRAPRLKTTFGEIEPLGFERFKICELVAELLHCSNMALLNENHGFDIVRVRDELRTKMKAFDRVSFKYNELIEMPTVELAPSLAEEKAISQRSQGHRCARNDAYDDTIDSFNSKVQADGSDDDDKMHANANLTEEQIRAKPVIGDFLKIALYDTQIITNILLMFFKFPWNNFLHNVVFDIVQQVLNGSMDIGFNRFLAINTFSLGNITHRITEGQRMCFEYEQAHGGLRLGYMGHLTLIAEEVVKFIQLYPVNTVSPLIDEKIEGETWQEYVNRVLYDTRKKYNAILGGSDVDDDDELNTFDESNCDTLEDALDEASMRRTRLDPVLDHDLMGAEYEAHDKEEEFREDVDVVLAGESASGAKDDVKFSLSDESESDDDDDHFARYMSHQLTNSAPGGFVGGKNKAFRNKKSIASIYECVDYRGPGSADDDDYIDPNDDGMSYRKQNSFYNALGLLKTNLGRFDRDLGEDSTSSSDSEDDDMGSATNALTRAASKG